MDSVNKGMSLRKKINTYVFNLFVIRLKSISSKLTINSSILTEKIKQMLRLMMLYSNIKTIAY